MAEDGTSPDNRSRGRRGRGGGAPERPTELPGGSWWAAVKRTVREFQVDNLKDWAAALTYYSVLSIFPALLVLISLIDLAGPGTIQTLVDNLGQVAPGSVNPNARQGFRWVSPGGLLAVVVWVAASAAFALYVANFGAYNKTYGSLASVIILLVWLWLSNTAILLGSAATKPPLVQTGPPQRQGWSDPDVAAGGCNDPDRDPFLPQQRAGCGDGRGCAPP